MISGAFATCNSYEDATVRGYAGAIKDLYNNGTLTGMDLHTYYGYQYYPIEAGHTYSAQHCFDAIKSSASITANLNMYVTEFNYARGGPNGSLSTMTEAYAAKAFLAGAWG